MQIIGQPLQLIEEPGAWYHWVVELTQIRKREFTPAKIPVRMAGPLDIKVVTQVKWRLDSTSHQLIDDDAVIEPPDLDLAPPTTIIEPSSAANQLGNADRRDAKQPLRRPEIGKSLLATRIDLHQNDFMRIMPVENHVTKQFQVVVLRQSIEKMRESLRPVDIEMAAVDWWKDILIGVE